MWVVSFWKITAILEEAMFVRVKKSGKYDYLQVQIS